MNKIYTGVISIVALFAIVASSAYAVFTTQADINGITLGTTTSGLQVKLGLETDSSYATSRTMETAFQLARISPGQVSGPGAFELRNNGTVGLNLTARIANAGGDWNLLKDKMQGIACVANVSVSNVCPDSGAGTTGWANLSYWNENQVALPGSPLAAGQESGTYITNFRLAADADNTYAGKTITDLQIVITGTQVTP